MTIYGEYRLDFWLAAVKGASQGCFKNKGAYKLEQTRRHGDTVNASSR